MNYAELIKQFTNEDGTVDSAGLAKAMQDATNSVAAAARREAEAKAQSKTPDTPSTEITDRIAALEELAKQSAAQLENSNTLLAQYETANKKQRLISEVGKILPLNAQMSKYLEMHGDAYIDAKPDEVAESLKGLFDVDATSGESKGGAAPDGTGKPEDSPEEDPLEAGFKEQLEKLKR